MSELVDRLNNAIMRGPIETPAWVINTMRDAAQRIAELESDRNTWRESAEALGRQVVRSEIEIAALRERNERIERLVKIAAGWMDDCKPLGAEATKVWNDNITALYEA